MSDLPAGALVADQLRQHARQVGDELRSGARAPCCSTILKHGSIRLCGSNALGLELELAGLEPAHVEQHA